MPAGEGAASPLIMRAHNVKSKHLSVGVLFADTVKARGGSIGTSGPPLSEGELDAQAGDQDLDVTDLTVDVLYAHDVEARSLTVTELHASKVEVGRGEESPPD